MSANVAPSIVRTELVLDLDAANDRSYVSGSLVWRDLTPNFISGSLINGPGFSSDGLGSLSFDGVDDKVEVETRAVSSIGGTNPRTMQVWVKNEKVGSYTTLGTICGYGSNAIGATGQLFMLSIYSNNAVFLWGNINNYTSTHTVTANEWTNLAVTFSGTSVRVYKNGIADSGGNVTLNTNTLRPYMIAQEYVGDIYQRLVGKVASNLVYNRVLTATEILQNYNAQRGRFGL